METFVRHLLKIIFFTVGYNEKDPLTRREQYAKAALYKISGETIYHTAIENALRHADTEGFRHICEQLKLAALDNLPMMEEILGFEAFRAVMNTEDTEPVKIKKAEILIKSNISKCRNQINVISCNMMIDRRRDLLPADKINELRTLLLIREAEIIADFKVSH